VRILFVLRHSGFVRNFEGVISELARRGHRIHLALEVARERAELAEALAARFPEVTLGVAPVRADAWTPLAYDLRAGVDALRYLGPLYADAPKLRARGLNSAPAPVSWLRALRPARHPRVLWILDRVLRRLDAALPVDPALDAWLAEQRPDRLLVTPLVAGPIQDDVVRAARARRVPTALCVTSWDNLTNKGLIRPPLDAVLVWNEAQRREAVELHGVPADRVVATGAHSYDHWFSWRPSRSRAALCAELGLPADRPLLLYLCSSTFIAPDERPFVRRWLGALRHGPASLRDAAVIVRPHPSQPALWAEEDLRDLGPVAVWPREGTSPQAAASKADYFDSLHACDAAVGINTSALIELAIVGRPAFTVLDPEFRATQEGTLHFSHLTDAGGGILTVAPDLPAHVEQLAAALADGSAGARERESFLRAFVRPHGLDVAGAPRMADAIEALAAGGPDERPGDGLLRALLAPLVRFAGGGRKRKSARARWERRTRRARKRVDGTRRRTAKRMRRARRLLPR